MDMDFEKILLEELEKENVYCDGDLIEGRGAFDAVMKFAEKYHQSKVNNSVLDDVNHQRGLLESFRDWHNNTKIADNNIHNGDLDDFLEDYNCG